MRKSRGWKVRRLSLETPNQIIMDGDENVILRIFSRMVAGLAIAAIIMAVLISANRAVSSERSLSSSTADAATWFHTNE